jgi:hypothetical protein
MNSPAPLERFNYYQVYGSHIAVSAVTYATSGTPSLRKSIRQPGKIVADNVERTINHTFQSFRITHSHQTKDHILQNIDKLSQEELKQLASCLEKDIEHFKSQKPLSGSFLAKKTLESLHTETLSDETLLQLVQRKLPG